MALHAETPGQPGRSRRRVRAAALREQSELQATLPFPSEVPLEAFLVGFLVLSHFLGCTVEESWLWDPESRLRRAGTPQPALAATPMSHTRPSNARKYASHMATYSWKMLVRFVVPIIFSKLAGGT